MTFLGPHTSVWWVFVAYLALRHPLALLFTPIFTASLGALPESLYSHGSAIVGTVQQVAGAAGTALLVTILSAYQVHPTATAPATVASTAVGVHWAFLAAAIISLLAIPAAFFIRSAPATGEPAPAAH